MVGSTSCSWWLGLWGSPFTLFRARVSGPVLGVCRGGLWVWLGGTRLRRSEGLGFPVARCGGGGLARCWVLRGHPWVGASWCRSW
jgi:hypothetical protein